MMSVVIEQIIAFSFVLLTCLSCGSFSQESVKLSFSTLECSYDEGWDNNGAFSIKVDSTGRVLVARNRWEPYQYYQGRLSQKDLNALFLKVEDAQIDKLEAHYKADSIPDKFYYNIWVTTLTHRLWKVQAYGDSVPSKLESLRQSVRLIRDTISLLPINQKITFATRTALYPTLPSIIKFVPPQQ